MIHCTSYIVCSLLLLCTISVKAQTLTGDSLKDIDGNLYKTVIIGNYIWMAANLRTTVYRDGSKIPKVTGNDAWPGLTGGAYCWYNNDENIAKTYGALYNWYAVNSGRLCPDGWRIPADEEWKYLEGYADTRYGIRDTAWDRLNGRGYDAGQRLMADSGWSSGGNGKDVFGFAAMPGGERGKEGRFFLIGRSGFWWSSNEYNASDAWYRNMIYGVEDVNRGSHPKWIGFSVRCLRDK